MISIRQLVLAVCIQAAVGQAPAIMAAGDMVTVSARGGLTISTGSGAADVAVLPALAALAAENSGLRSLVEGYEVRLAAAESRMTAALGRIDGVESRLGARETAAATLSETVVNNTAINNVNARTAAANGDRAEGLQRDVTILQQELAALNTSFYDTRLVRSSCLEHFLAGARVDGTYTIGPDENRPDHVERVFCDMGNGGWSLVAMSHTCSYRVTTPVNEPNDFFIAGFNSESNLLERNTNVDCMGPMAHHPSVFAGRLAMSSPQLKLVYHAEDDLATTATWFKDCTAQAFNTLFTAANVDAATQACQDEAMTQACRPSFIAPVQESWGLATQFSGMNIYRNGEVGGLVHMRMNHDTGPQTNGVCSMTRHSAWWPDNGGDGHWGNGFRLWLK